MLGNIGMSGVLLILVVLLIFFGPSKLPEIGKAFGRGLREFKNATNGVMDERAGVSPKAEGTPSTPEHHSVVEPLPIQTEADSK